MRRRRDPQELADRLSRPVLDHVTVFSRTPANCRRGQSAGDTVGDGQGGPRPAATPWFGLDLHRQGWHAMSTWVRAVHAHQPAGTPGQAPRHAGNPSEVEYLALGMAFGSGTAADRRLPGWAWVQDATLRLVRGLLRHHRSP